MKDATENSFNIIENNNHAFRSIKSPGSNKEFRMPHHVVSKHLQVIEQSVSPEATTDMTSKRNFQFGVPNSKVSIS